MKQLSILLCVVCYNVSWAQLPSYVPTDNLQAFYSYSGNVLDNSGNGHNNATYNLVLTTDRFNQPLRALRFTDSGNEYVNYGDVNAFENESQFSLSFWLFPENYGQTTEEGWLPILSKWASDQDPSNSSYLFYLDDNQFQIRWSDGVSVATSNISLNNFPLASWRHVVCTFGSGTCAIYVDGQLVADSSLSVPFIADSDAPFVVGDWQHFENPSFSSFRGKIDDLGIWNRVLAACEIEALFSGIACPEAGLTALPSPENDLLGVYDLLGRPTVERENEVLMYRYADGSVIKRCKNAY